MSEKLKIFISNIRNMLKKLRKMRFGRYDDEKVSNSRENIFCYQIFPDYVLTYLWERDMVSTFWPNRCFSPIVLFGCVIAEHITDTCGWPWYHYLCLTDSQHIFHKFHNFKGFCSKLWNWSKIVELRWIFHVNCTPKYSCGVTGCSIWDGMFCGSACRLHTSKVNIYLV